MIALLQKFTVSLWILRHLPEGTGFENIDLIEESDLYRRFRLMAGKTSAIRNMYLKTSDTSVAMLVISIPEKAEDGNYRISVAQVVDR
jgi:hypothetical protein